MRCARCGVNKRRLGPCGHCGARPSGYRLSDMEFDEISFVPEGANKKAYIVLIKSDEPADKVAKALQNCDPQLSHAQAISKALEGNPGLYSPTMPPPSSGAKKALPGGQELVELPKVL